MRIMVSLRVRGNYDVRVLRRRCRSVVHNILVALLACCRGPGAWNNRLTRNARARIRLSKSGALCSMPVSKARNFFQLLLPNWLELTRLISRSGWQI